MRHPRDYDEKAEAARTGKPYQTRLDPAPADSRVAHPPRDKQPEGVMTKKTGKPPRTEAVLNEGQSSDFKSLAQGHGEDRRLRRAGA